MSWSNAFVSGFGRTKMNESESVGLSLKYILNLDRIFALWYLRVSQVARIALVGHMRTPTGQTTSGMLITWSVEGIVATTLTNGSVGVCFAVAIAALVQILRAGRETLRRRFGHADLGHFGLFFPFHQHFRSLRRGCCPRRLRDWQTFTVRSHFVSTVTIGAKRTCHAARTLTLRLPV